MRSFIEAMFMAIDDRQFDRLADFFSDRVVYRRPGYEEIRGLDALHHFYSHVRQIRGGRHVIEKVIARDHAAVAVGYIDATLADGSSRRARFADVYRLRGGKILERETYFDTPAV